MSFFDFPSDILKKSLLGHRHINRGKNHFGYYIDSELFFKECSSFTWPGTNKSCLAFWLDKVRDALFAGEQDAPRNRVLIVSPSHATNASVIRFVNAHVFQGKAEELSIELGVSAPMSQALFKSDC
jgi:hypothetical protein